MGKCARHQLLEALGLRALLVCVLLCTVLLAGCSIQPNQLLTRVQGHGLPDLYWLNWGAAYFQGATWSPNGRWIAVEAGPDPADLILEVVSPNGHFRRSLISWNCELSDLSTGFASYAWQPDNALTCINNDDLITGSYPFTVPSSVAIGPGSFSPDGGNDGTWSSLSQTFVFSSLPNGLFTIARNGAVSATSLTPPGPPYASMPAWQPHQQAVAYLTSSADSDAYELLLSTAHLAPSGQLLLAPPRTLVPFGVDQYYYWSPTGHWLALRRESITGTDKIYLLNPAHPSQQVDVVVASDVGQQMMAPIWSPDGQQMIVFTVAYRSSQPYELNIGAYLRGKGLPL